MLLSLHNFEVLMSKCDEWPSINNTSGLIVAMCFIINALQATCKKVGY